MNIASYLATRFIEMSKELNQNISDKIVRKEAKRIGRVVTMPYIRAIGGQDVWVADVMSSSDANLLVSVHISENNRQIRNSVTPGSPVELQRDHAGFWSIVGRAAIDKGAVRSKTYNIVTAGLAFTEGLRYNGSGDLESGIGNEFVPGPEETKDEQYIFETIPFGDLDFGITPFGAIRYTRI